MVRGWTVRPLRFTIAAIACQGRRPMARDRARPGTDARVIEIDTDRVLARKQRHFAVIDVGSNSIRLVVYDDLSRAPFPRFNEKSFVALGAGLDAHRPAVAARRSTWRCARCGGSSRSPGRCRSRPCTCWRPRPPAARPTAPISSTAIREATGLETAGAERAEEATYAALGVISGFFQPKGLAGDMGGGSLEVAEVVGDRVGERMVSMPLGALPVRAMLAEGVDAAKKQIDAVLDASLPPLLTDPVFYAIGGGWRALARVHIAQTGAPISVVHGHDVAADEVRALAKKISRMTPAEVAALPDVPSRRVDTLPAAAAVLHRVLKMLQPERVVFSLLGLREGWLYAQLDAEERYRDPLLEGAMAIGLPSRPGAGVQRGAGALDRRPVPRRDAGRPAAAARRLRADRHRLARPREGARDRELPPAAAVPVHRHLAPRAGVPRGGDPRPLRRQRRRRGPGAIRDLLGPSALRRAEILGRVLLLGHRFSASVPELLEQARIRIDVDAVRLEMLNAERVPDSDAVQARLRQLARVSGVEGAEVLQVGD